MDRRAKLVALAFAALAGSAHAVALEPTWTAPTANSYQIKFASNGTPLLTQGARSITPMAGGAGLSVANSGKIGAGVGRATPMVNILRNAPWAAVGKAAASCLSGVFGAVACAASAAALYETLRVYGPGYGAAPGAGGLQHDPGQPGQEVTAWSMCDTAKFSSQVSVYTYCGNKIWVTGGGVTRWLAGSAVCEPIPGSGSFSCYGLRKKWSYTGSQQVNDDGSFTGQASPAIDHTCPAVVDPFDPAYSIPAGLPPGPDGKCRSARNNYQPMTEEEAGQLLAQRAPGTVGGPTQQQAVDALGRALDEGADLSAQPQVSGPASQTGDPKTTTTTGPAGTTTTTTTNNYHYNYQGDTISYTTTVITTVNHPDGTSETTQEGDPNEDKRDDCEKFPDRIGCQKLDKPVDEGIERLQKDFQMSPQGGWGADNGQCPVERHISVQGRDIPIPFDLVCQYMSGIRFAVIGAAWIAAAFIVMGFKGGD